MYQDVRRYFHHYVQDQDMVPKKPMCIIKYVENKQHPTQYLLSLWQGAISLQRLRSYPWRSGIHTVLRIFRAVFAVLVIRYALIRMNMSITSFATTHFCNLLLSSAFTCPENCVLWPQL